MVITDVSVASAGREIPQAALSHTIVNIRARSLRWFTVKALSHWLYKTFRVLGEKSPLRSDICYGENYPNPKIAVERGTLSIFFLKFNLICLSKKVKRIMGRL